MKKKKPAKKAKKAAPRKKAKVVKKKVVRLKVKTAKKKVLKTAKKKAPKKKAKRAPQTPKSAVVAPPNSRLLGRVEDYFAKIGVVALTLTSPVAVGARLHILGHTTNFEQTLNSMQIDHIPMTSGEVGDPIGIKVTTRARRGDYVYLILS